MCHNGLQKPFRYGQTGSGKTFTLVGSESHPGILPRVCERLAQEQAADETLVISVSMVGPEILRNVVMRALFLVDRLVTRNLTVSEALWVKWHAPHNQRLFLTTSCPPTGGNLLRAAERLT